MEVVASLSQGRTAAAQCGLFTHKSVPVIFKPPCNTGGFSTVHTITKLRLCSLLGEYLSRFRKENLLQDFSFFLEYDATSLINLFPIFRR